LSSHSSRAAQWWLHSGIQTPSGGVARYYRTDSQRNEAVSTEITGYAVSALVYLHALSGDDRLLDRASQAARFLSGAAWNAAAAAMPFELAPGAPTYFFDSGIVVRGLLAAWRATGDGAFRDAAVALGESMARDFVAADGDIHPILSLPEKSPAERDPMSWSRSPGCYQLKSAMAWFELAEATGREEFRAAYDRALQRALRQYPEFLPGHPDPLKVMDRLHAFCYFLEGMLPRATDPACARALADGIERAAGLLREIAPRFERSDVYAQLLRVRLHAGYAGAVPIDRPAAEWEAARLGEFQAASDDPRIDGGFYFGRRQGEWLPYVNPVSTAFALQTLALWDGSAGGIVGGPRPFRHMLI
jgi:hypothetical protein